MSIIVSWFVGSSWGVFGCENLCLFAGVLDPLYAFDSVVDPCVWPLGKGRMKHTSERQNSLSSGWLAKK